MNQPATVASENGNETDDHFCELPLERIEPKEGFNTRTYINEAELDELAESIRAQGVIQAIVVRPQHDDPERYWITVGERRWRASQLAGLTTIPARIKPMSEQVALVWASMENDKRVNISAGEEAIKARRMVDACGGDRDAAAKQISWSRSLLDARLLLLNAIADVIEALTRREILVGHAELLSTLPKTTQEGTLKKVIDEKWSVKDLKAKLDAFALDLALAKFNTHECVGCANNTTTQHSLFEQSVGEGRCTNRECHRDKTLSHLEVIKAELDERYNEVWFDKDKDPDTYTVLLKKDVGATQFDEGCQSCAHFGAIISTVPGEEGDLTEDVCTNLACRAEKMQAFLGETEEDTAEETTTATAKGTTGKASASKPKVKTKAKASSASTPKKVLTYVHQVHRDAAGKEVAKNPKMVSVYALLALLEQLGELGRSANKDDLLGQYKIKVNRKKNVRTGLIDTLYQLDEATLSQLTTEAAVKVAAHHQASNTFGDNEFLQGAQATLTVLGIALTDHFTVNKAFLETHTKKGIEAVLREAKFHEAYGNKEAFIKLFNQPNAKLIDKVMKTPFDWNGFIPRVMKLPTR